MYSRRILVVERDSDVSQLISKTLDEAAVTYELCAAAADAWDILRVNPGFTDVLLRMDEDDQSSVDLCRRIRSVKSRDQLLIIVTIDEKKIEQVATAVEAGADAVLAVPFEARELRLRMNLPQTSVRRRVDSPHIPESAVESDSTAELDQECCSEATANGPVSRLMIPRFDGQSRKMVYGVGEDQLAAWQNSETVTKVPLDRYLACPCCHAVPTFRPGCGACGSTWTEPEKLIHHYSCAHIASESEFRKGNDISCPKCLQSSLVVGSDFEVMDGGYVCSDCGAVSNSNELIGHCLSCQHRFAASEAVLLEMTGFSVPRAAEVTTTLPVQKNREPLEPSRSAKDILCSGT